MSLACSMLFTNSAIIKSLNLLYYVVWDFIKSIFKYVLFEKQIYIAKKIITCTYN